MTIRTLGFATLASMLAVTCVATNAAAQTEPAGSRCVYSDLTPQAPPPPPVPEPPRFNHQRHELALASGSSCSVSQPSQAADLRLPIRRSQ